MVDTATTFSKFYCKKCGLWLGVSRKEVPIKGIYPYCKHCKKNVEITRESSRQGSIGASKK